MADTDILVPVAHFSKEVFSTFGSPFLIPLTQGDTVGSVKQKIQDKVGVSKELQSTTAKLAACFNWLFLPSQ